MRELASAHSARQFPGLTAYLIISLLPAGRAGAHEPPVPNCVEAGMVCHGNLTGLCGAEPGLQPTMDQSASQSIAQT